MGVDYSSLGGDMGEESVNEKLLAIAEFLANGTGFSVASLLRELSLEESDREKIEPILTQAKDVNKFSYYPIALNIGGTKHFVYGYS